MMADVNRYGASCLLDFDEGVLLNIDKPLSMTSFGVVERIRRWTRCRRVGHAGTLDPAATGVLLVVTGKATKRACHLMELDKVYEGTINLGKSTDTDDREGRILEEKPVPNFSKAKIEDVLLEFQGEINQIPPVFSALKKNGQRLYKLARKGQTVEPEPRKVRVYHISLLALSLPLIKIRVHCSKGTYIRALARDIGQRLDTGGFLSDLRRTRVGRYTVEDAWSLMTLQDVLVTNESVSFG